MWHTRDFFRSFRLQTSAPTEVDPSLSGAWIVSSFKKMDRGIHSESRPTTGCQRQGCRCQAPMDGLVASRLLVCFRKWMPSPLITLQHLLHNQTHIKFQAKKNPDQRGFFRSVLIRELTLRVLSCLTGFTQADFLTLYFTGISS